MKHAVIVGASRLVGGYALRYLLADPTVGGVTSIGRRNLAIAHPRLMQILHPDFSNCSALADALVGHDAAVYCLGTYTGVVSDAQLRVITVDRIHARCGPDGKQSPMHATRERPRTC
jgi:hypothetical protein